MKLNCVTITGVDESVKPYDLCRLFDQYHYVEWGLLFSASREGKEPRYPSWKWIENLLERTTEQLPLAAHLCGQYSRDAVSGPFLWAVTNSRAFQRFQRIQFNGSLPDEASFKRLRLYGSHFPLKGFVIPVHDFPSDAYRQLPHLLLDNSGGRGIALGELPIPTRTTYCGYSGGLGPDNLESVLTKLTAMPGDDLFWVDMESGVRSDVDGQSVFDLQKVERCLEIAERFVFTRSLSDE